MTDPHAGPDPVGRLNAALKDRYTIEGEIGVGGMATVYLADDVRHDRKVAIKVLKPELAAIVGAERFLAEIKTTANLQHPHILPLHDSGEAEGFLFYVMPFVEGESLRGRLDRERQLSVKESVSITRKVAAALDYAHRRGVVHRDFKPANILLSEDGEPLVADFGIALAVAQAGGGRITETGLSLGTPHYMSPEQATGDRDIDPRSDVYAVGCVLYEMLAGEPPFSAPSAQAVLVQVLTTEAKSITSVRHTVPSHVGAVLVKALEKLPADRFESAAELATALDDETFAYDTRRRAEATGVVGRGAPGAGRRPFLRDRRAILALLAGAAVGAVGVVAGRGWLASAAGGVPGAVTKTELSDLPFSTIAISQDGTKFVGAYRDPLETGIQVYLRHSDDTVWSPIENTQGGFRPSLSPDGEWVVFQSADGLLRTVRVDGGPTREVGTGQNPHWGFSDEIVFTREGALYRVAGTGGVPEVLFQSDTLRADWPHLLPGGRGVLFSTAAGGVPLAAGVFLLDLESDEIREIAPSGNNPRYSSSGHVVYGHASGDLMAVAFDLETLQATGPRRALGPLLGVSLNGHTLFDVSAAGTLVYGAPDGEFIGEGFLNWVDMDGSVTPVPLETTSPTTPRISPNGERIAYGDGEHIWIHDVATGLNQPLTFEGINQFPVWSLDGRFVYFLSERSETNGFDGFRRVADGSDGVEQLWTGDDERSLTSISPDGRWLVLSVGPQVAGNRGPRDIALFDLTSDSASTPVLYLETADENESEGAVSPNGRWLAYWASVANGMFVRGFPEPVGFWRIIAGSRASEPVWAPDGDALYYVTGEGVVRVDVVSGETFAPGTHRLQFEYRGIAGGPGRALDIHPDGDRFVIASGGDFMGMAGTTWIVTNWFEELKLRMGGIQDFD